MLGIDNPSIQSKRIIIILLLPYPRKYRVRLPCMKAYCRHAHNERKDTSHYHN